jgi:hypothetical protein
MNTCRCGFWLVIASLSIAVSAIMGQSRTFPIIANHLSTDLDAIPNEWIDKARKEIKIYYGHASHGAQVTKGLSILSDQNARYTCAMNDYLPNQDNSLCMLDIGNDPDLFFSSVQDYINANPSLNVVMFSWCGEAAWYDVNHYISQMETLESNNPNVTFVYMTGNAQEGELAGYNRYLFNEALRDYCRSNNKVLFDFADLDLWYNGEYTPDTYDWDDWGRKPLVTGIPLEHPQYHGNEWGHTTLESCENKGRAAWWMFAKIAGWNQTVPVEMGVFDAIQTEQGVLLSWQTASETNNYGFQVQRSLDGVRFTSLGWVRGNGTTQQPRDYQFIDPTVPLGTRVWYRIVQMDYDGTTSHSSTINLYTTAPRDFSLYQNYPNPFNTSTRIAFSLSDNARIRLTITNNTGQLVKTLLNTLKPAGLYNTRWDGTDTDHQKVSSGIYFCALSVHRTDGRSFRLAKKMMLIN